MKKTFIIEDLDCAHCAAKIEEEIKSIKGVNQISVNFLAGKITLDAVDAEFDDIFDKAVQICKKTEPDCKVII